MKLVSFEKDRHTSWGIVDETGIIDLGGRYGGSVLQSLQQGLEVEQLQSQAATVAVDYSFEEVKLLPPVVRGEKIICVGVNYRNRNAEYKDNSQEQAWPSLFMRAYESFTGSGGNLQRPPESMQLDYEGEIVLVIGREGHRIPQTEAMDYIAGLTLMNEGTLRDWVRHAKFNVTQGKNFNASGSIGPWLVTADEFDNMTDLSLQTRVNGEVRQDDSIASMLFPFAYLISYLSIFYTLRPGDMISTGTPQGAGARFDPPRYLVPGDRIEVESPGIGVLFNGVEDASEEEDFTAQLLKNS